MAAPSCFEALAGELTAKQLTAKAISESEGAQAESPLLLVHLAVSLQLLATGHSLSPLTPLPSPASLQHPGPHRTPNLSRGSATPSSQSTVREFTDESGKVWSAVFLGDALIFTASDVTRGGTRANKVDLTTLDDSVSDDALRAWVNDAPRIGTLP